MCSFFYPGRASTYIGSYRHYAQHSCTCTADRDYESPRKNAVAPNTQSTTDEQGKSEKQRPWPERGGGVAWHPPRRLSGTNEKQDGERKNTSMKGPCPERGEGVLRAAKTPERQG